MCPARPGSGSPLALANLAVDHCRSCRSQRPPEPQEGSGIGGGRTYRRSRRSGSRDGTLRRMCASSCTENSIHDARDDARLAGHSNADAESQDDEGKHEKCQAAQRPPWVMLAAADSLQTSGNFVLGRRLSRQCVRWEHGVNLHARILCGAGQPARVVYRRNGCNPPRLAEFRASFF